MRYALLAIALDDVVQHLLAPHVAKVRINIRHAHALRIQKAFEEQMVAQRLHIGNVQQIRHHTARGAAAPRSYRDTLFATEVDKIPHNEEVGIVAHIVDDF